MLASLSCSGKVTFVSLSSHLPGRFFFFFLSVCLFLVFQENNQWHQLLTSLSMVHVLSCALYEIVQTESYSRHIRFYFLPHKKERNPEFSPAWPRSFLSASQLPSLGLLSIEKHWPPQVKMMCVRASNRARVFVSLKHTLSQDRSPLCSSSEDWGCVLLTGECKGHAHSVLWFLPQLSVFFNL